MRQSMNSVRLGDLIVHAGLATEDQVVDVIDGQSGRQAHIGSMFVERGILSSTGLRTAVQVQSLIRDGRLSLQSGSRLIAMASRGEISTTEIQAELDKRAGQKQPTTDERVTLGRLLCDAGIINDTELDKALKSAHNTGLPMGRLLVVMGVVNESVINQALDVQAHIRDGNMEFKQAITYLRRALSFSAETLESIPTRAHVIRLGELLSVSGVLKRSEVMIALETCLDEGKLLLGEQLVKSGAVQEAIIHYALILQQLVDAQKLSPRDACRRLHEKVAGRV